jgi:hypothetical protein
VAAAAAAAESPLLLPRYPRLSWLQWDLGRLSALLAAAWGVLDRPCGREGAGS